MNSRKILFDVECISMGLPPLSMGRVSAFNMIKKMPPAEKRKVLRKIRKVSKIEINRIVLQNKTSKESEQSLRDFLEHKANLAPKKSPSEKRHVLARLDLVSGYISHILGYS